jgi:hypothetical protein
VSVTKPFVVVDVTSSPETISPVHLPPLFTVSVSRQTVFAASGKSAHLSVQLSLGYDSRATVTSTLAKAENYNADSYDDRLVERLAATVAVLVQNRVQREFKKMGFMQGRAASDEKIQVDEGNLY